MPKKPIRTKTPKGAKRTMHKYERCLSAAEARGRERGRNERMRDEINWLRNILRDQV